MRASMTSGRLFKRIDRCDCIARRRLCAGDHLGRSKRAVSTTPLTMGNFGRCRLRRARQPQNRSCRGRRNRDCGWYVSPQPGRKVMLFFHGQGGQLVIQTGRWRRIREAGHGVLALSYRGYPGSKGSPTETGIHMDARAAFDWLAARHDKSEIVIHGHSLGTGVRSSGRRGRRPRTGARGAVHCGGRCRGERMPWFPVGLLMVDQFRSRDRIGKVRMPVLMVHGTSDGVIPLRHAERLFDLAKEPKVLGEWRAATIIRWCAMGFMPTCRVSRQSPGRGTARPRN